MNSNEPTAMHSSLIEALKELFNYALPKHIEMFGLDEVQEDGPKKMVGWLLEPLEGLRKNEFNEMVLNNIKTNRKEAEQYLAGLLGMM